MENDLTDREICICAAIRMPDGYIVRGHRHGDALHTAANIPRYQSLTRWPHGDDQGFITSRNRYVNRAEGLLLQETAGIKSANHEGEYWGHELYSEDLY